MDVFEFKGFDDDTDLAELVKCFEESDSFAIRIEEMTGDVCC